VQQLGRPAILECLLVAAQMLPAQAVVEADGRLVGVGDVEHGLQVQVGRRRAGGVKQRPADSGAACVRDDEQPRHHRAGVRFIARGGAPEGDRHLATRAAKDHVAEQVPVSIGDPGTVGITGA